MAFEAADHQEPQEDADCTGFEEKCGDGAGEGDGEGGTSRSGVADGVGRYDVGSPVCASDIQLAPTNDNRFKLDSEPKSFEVESEGPVFDGRSMAVGEAELICCATRDRF